MKKKIEPAGGVSKKETFPIVAIGASAGGIEAIKDLLLNLNPDLGFGYVYIQHLDPDHKSILSSILGKCTKMKVVQAEHLMHIERNHVYIIPPNKDMSVIDHVVILNPRKERPAIHMPVDRFFISLAEKHKNGAIGVVLSGNAHDGTAGLKAIKMAGGITFAQDETATFKGMPSSAVAEGVADFVLSPAEIAQELERISKRTHLFTKIRAVEANINDADEGLADIIQLLRKTVGVDFTHYKMSTIKRRILRRMVLHKAETLVEYYLLLKKSNPETVLLYQDLLINVTFFFRDADSIEFLKKTILPAILASKSSNEPVRIWVPACSTGEEAYSLAIILMELLGDNPEETDIQIFATDLSETAIAKARVGTYTVLELAEVPEAYVKKYFLKTESGYRINKQIRDICIFAHHNVFKDPPFSRLDLISCCNLFIYLNADLQKKIIATFYYALSPNGYLVLGKSETIGLSGQLFSQVQKKFKVYSKKPDSSGKAILEMGYRLPFTERTQVMEPKKVSPKVSTESTNIEKTVDGILQAKYIPGSVVINQEMEILQFRGSTSLFLEPSPGKASFNLMKMARPGLVFELRNTIHKATRTGEPVKKEGIDVLIKNNSYKVSVEVMPLKSENEDRLFLIIFEEEQPAPKGPKTVFSKDETALKLQEELNNVREDMRSIIEEQEVGKEELQSANEEIISSNEELIMPDYR
jgi:two-component system CheB/CheR fusion protein